jgi:hypothetical protein
MLAERDQKAASMPPVLRGAVRAAGDLKFRAKAHAFSVKVGAVAVVIALIGTYYLFVARPAARFEASQLTAREAARIRTDASTRQLAMDDCLAKAAAEAASRWKAACSARRERAGCALNARLNQELQRKESEERNVCLMKFSVTAQ